MHCTSMKTAPVTSTFTGPLDARKTALIGLTALVLGLFATQARALELDDPARPIDSFFQEEDSVRAVQTLRDRKRQEGNIKLGAALSTIGRLDLTGPLTIAGQFPSGVLEVPVGGNFSSGVLDTPVGGRFPELSFEDDMGFKKSVNEFSRERYNRTRSTNR